MQQSIIKIINSSLIEYLSIIKENIANMERFLVTNEIIMVKI